MDLEREELESNDSSAVCKEPYIDEFMTQYSKERFQQRFEVQEFLGEGASSKVYKVHDILLERTLALKIIHKHLINDEKARNRFKNEAGSYSSLDHAGIVRSYTQGECPDGRLYLLIDYLEGESLKQYLEKNGKLDLTFFFQVFSQIIDALACAHKENILHRDLKPSNIMLVRQEDGLRVYLLDFGIAKYIGEKQDQKASLTTSILGSSAYMSPEQCLGLKDIDQRSDIYSLCCVIYEALSGKALFQGSSDFELMYKHLNDSLSGPGHLHLKGMPNLLSKLLERGLQKDREKRYQSIDELASDFARCRSMSDSQKLSWETGGNKAASKRIFSMAAGIALLFVSVFCIIKSQKANKSLDLKAAGVERAASIQHLPIGSEGLKILLDGYNAKLQYDKGLDTLMSWQALHGKSKSISKSERCFVDNLFSLQYALLNNEKQALSYANKVFSCDLSGAYAPYIINALGQMYIRMNRQKDFLTYLDQTLEKHKLLSNSLDCLLARENYCSQYFLGQADYKKAERSLRLAQSILAKNGQAQDSDFNYLHTRLVEVLLMQKKRAEAEKLIEQCFRNTEANTFVSAELNKSIGQSMSNAGYLSDSCQYFRQAIRIFKSKDETGQELGIILVYTPVLMELKRHREAKDLFKDCMSRSQNKNYNVIILGNIAMLELAMNNQSQALKSAREANRLAFKTFRDNKAELANSLYTNIFAQTIFTLGTLFDSLGKKEEAMQNLKEWQSLIEKEAPDSAMMMLFLDRQIQADMTYMLLDEALMQTNLALKKLELPKCQFSLAAVQSNPQVFKGHLHLLKSRIFESKKDYKKAAEAARTALAILESAENRAELLDAQALLARNLCLSGESEAARKELPRWQSLLRLQKHELREADAAEVNAFALICLRLKEYERAETSMKTCLELLKLRYEKNYYPHLSYCSTLAQAYSEQGKNIELIELLEPRVDLSLSDPKQETNIVCLKLLRRAYAREGLQTKAVKLSQILAQKQSGKKEAISPTGN